MTERNMPAHIIDAIEGAGKTPQEQASASSPCPPDSDLMKAWKAYQATNDFKNSKHWAMTIAPMIQSGDPDGDRKRYGLMPIEQREGHVQGSLWAAFMAGFIAAGGKVTR